MPLTPRPLLAFALCLSTGAWAEAVRFRGPESVRAAVRATLQALKFQPLDDSPLDAYMGELIIDASAGGPQFPPEMVVDAQEGLAACERRPQKPDGSQRSACWAQLGAAAWQRHLERNSTPHVVEVRRAKQDAQGWVVDVVRYAPKDRWALGTTATGATANAAMKKALTTLLVDNGGERRRRSNSSALPTADPPKVPVLTQGKAQKPGAVPLPQGCALPRLVVEPAVAPLAKSLDAVWAATASASGALKPLTCKLGLLGAPGQYPAALELSCGGSQHDVALFPGDPPLSDAEFQAEVARALAEGLIRATCR